VAAGATII